MHSIKYHFKSLWYDLIPHNSACSTLTECMDECVGFNFITTLLHAMCMHVYDDHLYTRLLVYTILIPNQIWTRLWMSKCNTRLLYRVETVCNKISIETWWPICSLVHHKNTYLKLHTWIDTEASVLHLRARHLTISVRMNIPEYGIEHYQSIRESCVKYAWIWTFF